MIKLKPAFALLGASALAACGTVGAQTATPTTAYDVTITNNSPQVVTPPFLVTHRSNISVFTVGGGAVAPLATQAETGDPGQLVAAIGTSPSVGEAVAGDGPVLPGETKTIRITTNGGADYLTATAMFATTNDAFWAVQSIPLPSSGTTNVTATVYDAGTEANNELCSHIPGPPCAGDTGNERATAGAEGVIAEHPGLTGTGDLDAGALNWNANDITIAITPAS